MRMTGTAPTPRPAFVLHDHRKTRPHFDLRLEEDGVLRSWAVPRGLPTGKQNRMAIAVPAPDVAQTRMAIAVPDHELDHLTSTDEDKSIADSGWWEEVDRTDRRIVFVLHGREQSTRYALINTGDAWLL